MSREETLLNALVNDETTDIVPITRSEKYLKACCDKCGCQGLPSPISREDQLLYNLADKIKDLKDVSDTTATANKVLSGYNFYLATGTKTTGTIDTYNGSSEVISNE